MDSNPMNGDIDMNGIKIIDVNSNPIEMNGNIDMKGNIDMNGIKRIYIPNN